MEQNKDLNQFDIPLAKRTYLNNSTSILKKKVLIYSPFLLLLFSIALLRLTRNIKPEPLINLNFQSEEIDKNRK